MIYVFTIDGRSCKPLHTDIKREYELQQNEQFYRSSLSGTLTFLLTDYDYILSMPFDTIHNVKIYTKQKSTDAQVLFFEGEFTRINCKIDYDNKNIKVSLKPVDKYDVILEGYNIEHNLIALSPSLKPVYIDIRPIIQVYALGAKTVSNFQGDSSWDIDVEPIDTETYLIANKFDLNKTPSYIEVYNAQEQGIAGVYMFNESANKYIKTTNDYELIVVNAGDPSAYGETAHRLELRALGGTSTLYSSYDIYYFYYNGKIDVMLTKYGTGNGDIKAYTRGASVKIYTRLLTARTHFSQLSSGSWTTYDCTKVLDNDFNVSDNHMYAIGITAYNYSYDSPIQFSLRSQVEPTPYGKNNEGRYFLPPDDMNVYHPIGRLFWIHYSMWYTNTIYMQHVQDDFALTTEIKDTFELHEAFELLIKKIDPSMTFTSWSLSGLINTGTSLASVYLSQKTNVLKPQYDDPAKVANMSLRGLLDFVRDAFGCYWYLDENGLRVEHIDWFRNGCDSQKSIGTNLTTLSHVRHARPMSFGKNVVQFDTNDMPQFIRYEWGDKTSKPFSASQIELASNYVTKAKTETFTVSNFNADIDTMISQYNDQNKDGFAVIAARWSIGNIVNISVGVETDKYLADNKGTTTTATGANTTWFFAVYSGATYWYVGKASRISWYRSDGKYLSQIDVGYGGRLTVPANARFARMSYFGAQTMNIYDVADSSILKSVYEFNLQNGHLSFRNLIPKFLNSDMPAQTATFENNNLVVKSVKRIRSQEIWCSSIDDINPNQLVQTELGDAKIAKVTTSLTSGKTSFTLNHDIE